MTYSDFHEEVRLCHQWQAAAPLNARLTADEPQIAQAMRFSRGKQKKDCNGEGQTQKRKAKTETAEPPEDQERPHQTETVQRERPCHSQVGSRSYGSCTTEEAWDKRCHGETSGSTKQRGNWHCLRRQQEASRPGRCSRDPTSQSGA